MQLFWRGVAANAAKPEVVTSFLAFPAQFWTGAIFIGMGLKRVVGRQRANATRGGRLMAAGGRGAHTACRCTAPTGIR